MKLRLSSIRSKQLHEKTLTCKVKVRSAKVTKFEIHVWYHMTNVHRLFFDGELISDIYLGVPVILWGQIANIRSRSGPKWKFAECVFLSCDTC